MLSSQIPFLKKKFRSKTNVLLENANIPGPQGSAIYHPSFSHLEN